VAKGCACNATVLKGCACLGVFLLFLAACGLIFAVVSQFIGQPNAIQTTLAADKNTLAVGELLTITITVENVDVDSVTIAGIGLNKKLLDGASLETLDPLYRSIKKHSYPIYGEWHEYTLDQTLLGGEKLKITLTLKAAQPGTYSGDVTVWVESSFYGVSMAQARREHIEFKVQ
jgi:hypothetical protein